MLMISSWMYLYFTPSMFTFVSRFSSVVHDVIDAAFPFLFCTGRAARDGPSLDGRRVRHVWPPGGHLERRAVGAAEDVHVGRRQRHQPQVQPHRGQA